MSQPRSSFRNAKIPVRRRLQTPAERFGTPDLEIEETDFAAPVSSAPRRHSSATTARSRPNSPESTEPTDAVGSSATVAADDPFQPLPGVSRSRSRRKRNGRRVVSKARAPKVHEKRAHQVAHFPVNPSPSPEPRREGSTNTMTRALLARKRARTRRFVARIFGIALILFVAQCAVAALTAPQFQIQNVEVQGLDETPAAAVSQLTSTLAGQNIFRAPAAAVAQKVESLPTVAQARIVRPLQWPPHLSLEVTERQPILRVGSGQNWWVADAQGVPYRRATQADESLYALTSPQFVPQTGRVLPVEQWKRAHDLVLALQADNNSAGGAGAAPFWKLRRLYLDGDGFASVRVSGGGDLSAHRELLIRLGDDKWPAKLAQARQALNYFERTGQRANELDLVSSEHPRWQPLNQVAQTPDTAVSTS